MNDSLADRVAQALGVSAVGLNGLEAGALSSTGMVLGPGRERFFLKCVEGGDPRQLPGEARSLRLLSEEGGMRVPEVRAVESDFMLLDWIDAVPATPRAATLLGESLARMHRCGEDRWGQEHDTWCGLTRHPRGWHGTAEEWFRVERIGRLQELLRGEGRLSANLESSLMSISDRLGHWLSGIDEEPALCHGDLWGGNWLNGVGDIPHVIDPAPVYGLRDADLAMAELFGGFPPEFFDAYGAVFPLSPGYRMRQPLMDLAVLLNHAVLFGGGYIAQCERAAASLAREVG